MTENLSEYAKGLLNRWSYLNNESVEINKKLETLESLIAIEGLSDRIYRRDGRPLLDSTTLSEHRPEISRRQKRRIRAESKKLNELQQYVENLLQHTGNSLPLAEIEKSLVDQGIPLPGNGTKANLVQELISKAGHVFVRLGHGQYGLSVWVGEEAAKILDSRPNHSMDLPELIEALKNKGLMTHGTYSIPTLVDILTASGSLELTENDEIAIAGENNI